MHLGGAVEDVVGGHVDERDPCPAQVRARRAGPVALAFQAVARPSGVSRFINRRVGAAVDHGAVERPVVLRVGVRVGHVEGVDVAEVEVPGDAALLGQLSDRMPQLAVAAGDEGALRRHRDDVPEHRVVEVGLGTVASSSGIPATRWRARGRRGSRRCRSS